MATKNHSTKNAYYSYGSLARNLDVVKATNEAELRPVVHSTERHVKTESRRGFGFVYALFLSAMLAVTGIALISYIKLQSDITSMVDNIASYESTLNNLTLANDDEYSKMINTIDYEEIKRVAIEELGMVYASEDQIITYTRENSDYVRQLNDLSD